MTDHNRGAYTPQSEAPLAFDARRTRGGGDRPFPLALVISAVILVLIVIALVVFLMRQPDGSDASATDDGGAVVDAMKAPPAETGVPTTAPPSEMQISVEDPAAPPAFTPPPEQPGARPAQPAPDPVGALTIAPKAPVAAAPKAPAPSAMASVAPKAAPAAAAPKAPAPVAGGSMVQIGAFTSAGLAEKGWNDLAGQFPGQMAGKTKRVETVDANGTTLHRAFVGGFDSRAQADAFCAALKAANRQCLVR